ncbi:unnamed protein product [marine sediment metagenome]|uniref:ADP-ribosylglycohydrolase n=1 Tax=marine sediment metagenome TaxID=412755 RepID=X1FCI1_9ZZZZ
MLEYASLIDSISNEDVELYFSFIDPILDIYFNNPDSRDQGTLWAATNKKDWPKTLDGRWWLFEQSMTTDALSRFKDYPSILERRIKSFSKSKGVHTLYNNAAIVVGLLYGDGDFIQTVRISTECGADTDCNAGNAGSILGAYLGQKLTPSYVKRFTRDEIIPGLKEWKDKSIRNLAERTLAQTERFKKFSK